MSVGVGVSVLDGFGLAMFLPLLQLVGGEAEATGEGMGQLGFLVSFVESVGIALNLRNILVILIVFFVIKGVLSYIGQVYQVHIRQYFLRTLRLQLLLDFNRIDFKQFIRWDVGRVQNAFTTETERISIAFVHYFRTLNLGVHVVVYAGFAFSIDPQFALLVIAGGGLSHFLFRFFYVLSRKASRQLSQGNSNFHGLVLQYIANFKYLKATARHLVFGKKLELSVLRIESENTRLGVYGAVLGAVREPLLIIVVAIVIIFQTEVLAAPLAPIMISLLFFYRALASLNTLQSTWNLFIRFSGSLENVDHFVRELREGKERGGGQLRFEGISSSIALKNVSFHYGEKRILDNISLCIRQNEAVAIVGESGSGKSTLLNIICGLLCPSSGEYLIDGRPFSEIDPHSFQKRVGFISQEPVIFNATIYENITFWAGSEGDRERFDQVLQLAALLDFVETLPDKENTIIGNNGIDLSGGQRQRIAIARELYRDVDVLILDEATAALDSETERYIQTSIEGLRGRYTIITVAHRLATIRNADRVILMNQGRLVNALPFDELMRREEKFRKMVELQDLSGI